MTVRPEIVVFENRHGQKLFGTLHHAENGNPDLPVIVLLSPGVKMRVGPHRLYNRMTAEFNRLGYTVFKFDFMGLGDSEGELDRELLAEVYNDTESGAFVDDSVDALDWLEQQHGYRQFLLGGLCGGAITGILLAERDERAVGLISLGMTTTLAMGAADRTTFATQGELAGLRRGYLRRLLDPKSWLRLLTFQSDFRTLFRSLLAPLRKKPAPAPQAASDPAESDAPQSNANPLFPKAFFKVTGDNRKVLLIFSEADRLYWDFDEKFAQPYAARLADVEHSYELHVVKHANHVFSFREWERDMLDLTRQWLQANFAPAQNS